MPEHLEEFEYIKPEDLFNIINEIRNFEYENEEEIPDYDAERQAIDEYFSLIDRSKTHYYPSIFEKASFLFININSHYFSNGNKRLATVSTVYFLALNNYKPISLDKSEYKNLLHELFANPNLNDWEGFNSVNFGLYNLAIVIARHNEEKNRNFSNDELKEKVKIYFQKSFSK